MARQMAVTAIRIQVAEVVLAVGDYSYSALRELGLEEAAINSIHVAEGCQAGSLRTGTGSMRGQRRAAYGKRARQHDFLVSQFRILLVPE